MIIWQKHLAINFIILKNGRISEHLFYNVIFYMCKMPNSSTVHHIKELTPMNIDDSSISINPDNLVTLCNRCHNLIHDKYKYSEDRKRYTFDAEGNVIPRDASATNELTNEQQRLINFYKSQLT